MSRKRLFHISTSVAAALAATLGAVALDAQRSGVHQATAGLNWARQIASQVEGLSFKARDTGEADPLGFAVNYLAQGVEPRLIHITRLTNSDASAQNTETYLLDRAVGTFDYSRILTPETGAGVRIQLVLGYNGFLGAKSPLASDGLAAAFFAFCFGISFFLTSRLFGFSDSTRIRALVTEWVGGAKSHLTRLSVHVREMVRQSQRLAASSGKSRGLVGELRDKIHDGINGLRDGRQFYQDGESIAARAESLALNAAIEANRIGGDARRIADMATELHRCIQSLRAVNRKGQALVQSFERHIEPWATDADIAYHAFDDVKDATEHLSRHIRSTTETLLGQARLIQSLNQELGAPQASAPPPTPRESAPAAVPLPSPGLPEPLPPLEDKVKTPLLEKLRRKKSA